MLVELSGARLHCPPVRLAGSSSSASAQGGLAKLRSTAQGPPNGASAGAVTSPGSSPSLPKRRQPPPAELSGFFVHPFPSHPKGCPDRSLVLTKVFS